MLIAFGTIWEEGTRKYMCVYTYIHFYVCVYKIMHSHSTNICSSQGLFYFFLHICITLPQRWETWLCYHKYIVFLVIFFPNQSLLPPPPTDSLLIPLGLQHSMPGHPLPSSLSIGWLPHPVQALTQHPCRAAPLQECPCGSTWVRTPHLGPGAFWNLTQFSNCLWEGSH